MGPQRKGLPAKLLTLILNIGVDPRDSEYIRLIKRIWYVATAVSLPVSLSFTVSEFASGHTVSAAGFLLSFFLFLAVLVDGARRPGHFERNALYILAYFVVGPAVMTVALGGVWRSQGAIMIGLLGPLFALLFPARRRAFYLFGIYAALVLVIGVFWPFPLERGSSPLGLNPFQFWFGFLILLGFIFGGMYFFVVQREKAHILLGLEKEKSESLLRRIEKDLTQAAEIQKRLLPGDNPRFEGFDIAGANIPCYEVGGDYYDFVPIDADRLGIVIADVSGKGISASLLMASLRAALLAEVRADFDVAGMTGRLNDFVHRSTDSASFITFFFGALDRRTGELRYVNAGHNPPFIVRRSGGISDLGTSGLALGMFPGTRYESRTEWLEAGDTAVLFTDGIVEARNGEGKEFTEERFREAVARSRDLPAGELRRRVLEDARSFAATGQPCDDITLVVVKKTGAGDPALLK
ncbi:MAG: PP2C family protein-serine/threonine phosphatase [Candidatus Aminicenantales bacterium]|jgi:serine phosphatase RsbU (regulator of sigma subunit)